VSAVVALERALAPFIDPFPFVSVLQFFFRFFSRTVTALFSDRRQISMVRLCSFLFPAALFARLRIARTPFLRGAFARRAIKLVARKLMEK
jgi:hypothetical protein